MRSQEIKHVLCQPARSRLSICAVISYSRVRLREREYNPRLLPGMECGRRHLTGHVPYCTRVIENDHSWPRTGSRPSAARAPTAKRVPSFRPRQAAVTQYSHFCARWASLGRQSLPTRADPSEEAADVALREKQRTRCRTRRAPSSVSGDSSPLLTTSSNSTLSIVGWGDLGIGRRPGSRCIGHGYPSVATD